MSTADFGYGSCMVFSPVGYGVTALSNPRNHLCRPASRGHRDAAVEFISSQSPGVAVSMPQRVIRAE
jgi:hypothetical protein